MIITDNVKSGTKENAERFHLYEVQNTTSKQIRCLLTFGKKFGTMNQDS